MNVNNLLAAYESRPCPRFHYAGDARPLGLRTPHKQPLLIDLKRHVRACSMYICTVARMKYHASAQIRDIFSPPSLIRAGIRCSTMAIVITFI